MIVSTEFTLNLLIVHLSLIVIIAMVYPSATQLVLIGKCPTTPTPVGNFDLNAFSGKWYAIQSYPYIFTPGTCITETYTVNPNGTVTIVNNRAVASIPESSTGLGTLVSSGILSVTYSQLPVARADETYIVVATDYVNYAVGLNKLKQCENILN